MEYFPAALEKLVEQFARLPGIGSKSAQRLAFFVLSLPEEEAKAFADAIVDAKRTVTFCPVCRNLTDGGLCPICSSPKRDEHVICVVADPRDVVLVVASDRISAYDHVLASEIPDKGVVLTQLSLWWFDQLADVVDNHVVTVEVSSDPADGLVPAAVDGRAMVCRRLEMFPVECVVRGYLTGSGLVEYRADRTVCGVPLPAGLVDGSRLPEAIFTIRPSAELSSEQTVGTGGDPLVYPYHDKLFRSFLEQWRKTSPAEILLWYSEGTLAEHLGCEADIISEAFPDARSFIADLEHWWKLMHTLAVAKRIQAPPIVSITRRAYGYDHREAQLTPYFPREYHRLKAQLLND